MAYYLSKRKWDEASRRNLDTLATFAVKFHSSHVMQVDLYLSVDWGRVPMPCCFFGKRGWGGGEVILY